MTKNKKYKKNKINILKILIPTLAVTTTAAFVAPMIVSMSQPHVKMNYESQRWATTKTGQFTYKFLLLEPIKDDQTFNVTSTVTSLSDAPCEIELDGLPVKKDKKTFEQKIIMKRIDGQDLETEDRSLFDFHFELINADGTVAWKDKIEYLSIVYRV